MAGARYTIAILVSGAGRARVSSLPLTVNGSASSTTTAAGTMNSGSRSATKPRSSVDSFDRRRVVDGPGQGTDPGGGQVQIRQRRQRVVVSRFGGVGVDEVHQPSGRRPGHRRGVSEFLAQQMTLVRQHRIGVPICRRAAR